MVTLNRKEKLFPEISGSQCCLLNVYSFGLSVGWDSKLLILLIPTRNFPIDKWLASHLSNAKTRRQDFNIHTDESLSIASWPFKSIYWSSSICVQESGLQSWDKYHRWSWKGASEKLIYDYYSELSNQRTCAAQHHIKPKDSHQQRALTHKWLLWENSNIAKHNSRQSVFDHRHKL